MPRLQQYHEETEEGLDVEAKRAKTSEHAGFAAHATILFVIVGGFRIAVVVTDRIGVAPTIIVAAVDALAVVTVPVGGESGRAPTGDRRALQRR